MFVKGNVDVHDSLHSCVIGGTLRWNGINEVLRQHHPGTLIRIKHETWIRSDALLTADGVIDAELAARSFKLGPFPLASQFSQALFETPADAIILTIQPDMATQLLRHRTTGQFFYPYEMIAQEPEHRNWLAAHYEPAGLLAAEQSMANFEQIIGRIRSRTDAPILIYNVSAAIPGETVHCLQGLGETFTTRARRFTLGLAELSEKTGISIIDVDSLLARSGVDKMKLNALHITPEAHELVAREVVRVLDDLGLFGP